MPRSKEAEVVVLKIGDVSPHPRNPKKHYDAGIEASIKDKGYIELVVVDEKNRLLAGQGRWEALKRLGHKEIKVIRKSGLTERQKLEYLIASNKLTERGGWDEEILKTFDKDILAIGGFASEEIDELFSVDVKEDDFDADAEYAKISEPIAKRGDVYQLGAHRLMCGDSTQLADVEKLMDGEKANMVFTDPPYNVDYTYAKYEAIHRGRKRKFANGGKIFNDKLKPEEFYKFLLGFLKNVFVVTREDMTIYVCHSTSTQDQFFQAFRDAGFHFSQTIIWMKERIILAMGQDYHRVYEPILYGWKNGKKRYANRRIHTEKEIWNLDKLDFEQQLDLWYLHRDKSADYIHPTQKPVRLPERAIKKNCPRGGAVLDLFNGSGSTMLACEQLSRRCYAMELDGKYIDVAIKRFEEFTGQKAKKIS